MAGRPKKAYEESDETEVEAEVKQAVEQKAAPVSVDPEQKVSIKKGGVTRIRRLGDIGQYIADGWVRV
jgi:hypothetical protein